MRDPFAAAARVLHGSVVAVAADFMPLAGNGVEGIKIIKTTTPIDIELGGSLVRAGSTIIEIQKDDVPAPLAGDRLLIGATVVEILGEPKLDVEQLTWTCEAAEILG